MNRLTLAAALAAVSLSACGKTGGGASSDPYSGLESEILHWRTVIEASHPACKIKAEGKGCEGFEVRCKAMQEITPDETAKGITAQVIAAMSFNGHNDDGSTGRNGSAFATFSKAGNTWTRAEAMPVNLSTCAPL